MLIEAIARVSGGPGFTVAGKLNEKGSGRAD
jgi:hypothetical protein